MNQPEKEQMYIITVSCYKCEKDINIAVMYGNTTMRGPELFSLEEIKIAKEQDVKIMEQYSYTMGTTYQANTCGQCNAFVGQHFLPEYLSDALYGDYEYKKIDIV